MAEISSIQSFVKYHNFDVHAGSAFDYLSLDFHTSDEILHDAKWVRFEKVNIGSVLIVADKSGILSRNLQNV